VGINYNQLSSGERATLQAMLAEGSSQSSIANRLGRSRSTISRELGRNGARLDYDTGTRLVYDAVAAEARARALAAAPALNPKLGPNTPLFAVVREQLAEGWSPEQVAGRLKMAFCDDPTRFICHETIYTAIYVLPRGDLRRELISSLRQARGKRRPRSRGDDRRGRIADMASIHTRPPEVADRLVPGHWEGDLIKGARNASSVGTLIERSSRLLLLARMDNATADGALDAFTTCLNRVHGSMRKSLTYDQGREMARHKELAGATGISVYFADPHSPWQRGSNENTNGLIRQYLPKGIDLSTLSQGDLDAIAHKLNTRPRRMHGFRTPIEVYAALQREA
jgi:IS30 family transposase